MTVLIQVQLLPNQTAAIQLPPEAAGHGRRLEALYLFVQRAAQWLHPRHPEARFYLQLLDEEPDAPCFRFDGPLAADGGGPLIPDPYALGSHGYAAIRARFASEPLPPWEERLPIAIWRGSSTGTLGRRVGASLARAAAISCCWASVSAMVRLACFDPIGGSGGGRAGQARVLPPRPASGQDGR